MARRDTFPFASHRAVMDAFMMGKANIGAGSAGELEVRDRRLLFAGVQIAHYDTGGSLVAVPGWDMMGGYTIHMIHYMLSELGSDARIVRQRDIVQDDQHATGHHMRYFFEDREIAPSEPIVLAGPLSIQAYRAQPLRFANPE